MTDLELQREFRRIQRAACCASKEVVESEDIIAGENSGPYKIGIKQSTREIFTVDPDGNWILTSAGGGSDGYITNVSDSNISVSDVNSIFFDAPLSITDNGGGAITVNLEGGSEDTRLANPNLQGNELFFDLVEGDGTLITVNFDSVDLTALTTGGAGGDNIDTVLSRGGSLTANRTINFADKGITFDTNSDVKTWITKEPSTYGITYSDAETGVKRMDRWYEGYCTFPGVNLSSRPNVVKYEGYNATPQGGRVDTGDAAWQNRWETHYENGEGSLFEFHLPELYTVNGTMLRLFSMYANKINGRTLSNMTTDNLDFNTYNTLDPYAQIGYNQSSPGVGAGQLYLRALGGGGGNQPNITLTYNNPDRNDFQILNDGATPTFQVIPNGAYGVYNYLRFRGASRYVFYDAPLLQTNGSLLLQSGSLAENESVVGGVKMEIREGTYAGTDKCAMAFSLTDNPTVHSYFGQRGGAWNEMAIWPNVSSGSFGSETPTMSWNMNETRTNKDIEITDATKGIIMSSPDGTRYRLTILNGGTLNISAA